MDMQRHADEIPVPSAVAEDKPPETATRATPVSSLLREIARAMQTAAKRERDRIDAGMGVEETAQVEKIQARAAEEAAALRTGADDDVASVNAWYEDEIRRIREEADRRIADRRQRLELSITQHGSLIAAETESVHRAIQDYRASLGDFFGRLADEQDPSAIARLAGTLPEQPDIDAARADARSQGDAGARGRRDGRAAPPSSGAAGPERWRAAQRRRWRPRPHRRAGSGHGSGGRRRGCIGRGMPRRRPSRRPGGRGRADHRVATEPDVVAGAIRPLIPASPMRSPVRASVSRLASPRRDRASGTRS